MAQRAISPTRRQAQDRTQDQGQSNTGIRDYYKPTPLLLGNPVYGTNKSQDADSMYGSTVDFRPGLRRQGSKEDRKKTSPKYV